MIHRFYLSTLLLALCLGANSQTKFAYYFNSDLNIVDSSKATFIGIGTPESGLLKLECYSKSTRMLSMVAWFKDSTLTTNHGLFKTYYNNGYKENEGNYVNGKEDGLWQKWDSLGYLIDSTIYKKGEEVARGVYRYHDDGSISEYYFTDLKKKTRITASYDEKHYPLILEDLLDGTGFRKVYEDGKLKSSTEFFDGKVHKYIRYKADGTEVTKKEILAEEKLHNKEREEMVKKYSKDMPEYPGGDNAFNMYVGKKLVFTGSLANDIRVVQQVKFSFMLNENGHAYDIKMLDYTNADLDALIRNILEHMPAWKMKGVKQYGPVTRAYNIR